MTIDLNGHTLYGAGTSVGSTGTGISSGTYTNILILNGIIRDFRYSGIYTSGANTQVTEISAFRNYAYGIYVNNNAMIWNNTVYGNGGTGIRAGNGSTVTGNSIRANGSYGIITNYGCTITGNSIYANGNHGISANDSCTVKENSVVENGGTGIEAASNGCIIIDNTVYTNSGNGIRVTNACQVIGNTICYHNDTTGFGRGIYVNGTRNRIDSNHIINNLVGIYFDDTTNWYGRNTLRNTSADTAGSAPADPASPYTNIFL